MLTAQRGTLLRSAPAPKPLLQSSPYGISSSVCIKKERILLFVYRHIFRRLSSRNLRPPISAIEIESMQVDSMPRTEEKHWCTHSVGVHFVSRRGVGKPRSFTSHSAEQFLTIRANPQVAGPFRAQHSLFPTRSRLSW